MADNSKSTRIESGLGELSHLKISTSSSGSQTPVGDENSRLYRSSVSNEGPLSKDKLKKEKKRRALQERRRIKRREYRQRKQQQQQPAQHKGSSSNRPIKIRPKKKKQQQQDIYSGVPLLSSSSTKPWRDSMIPYDYSLNEKKSTAKEMIVLDLNGTLIKRTKRNTFGGCRYGYARPYLHKFLRFILDNFAVMVWSSAQPNSVFNMLKVMFGGMDKELVRVWDRRFCELDDHYFSNAESLKDLTRITNGFNLGHSPFKNIYKSYTGGYSGIDNEAKQGRWTLENIVLVDDSEEKAAKQQANHLFVTTFDDIHKGDKELLVLVKYLQRYAENRQAFDSLVSYMQSNPWLEFRDSCVVDEDEEAIFQNKQPF